MHLYILVYIYCLLFLYIYILLYHLQIYATKKIYGGVVAHSTDSAGNQFRERRTEILKHVYFILANLFSDIT